MDFKKLVDTFVSNIEKLAKALSEATSERDEKNPHKKKYSAVFDGKSPRLFRLKPQTILSYAEHVPNTTVLIFGGSCRIVPTGETLWAMLPEGFRVIKKDGTIISAAPGKCFFVTVNTFILASEKANDRNSYILLSEGKIQ